MSFEITEETLRKTIQELSRSCRKSDWDRCDGNYKNPTGMVTCRRCARIHDIWQEHPDFVEDVLPFK